MKSFLIGLCILSLLASFSCRRDEPACVTCSSQEKTISLDTVLVDPAEVWLKVTLADSRGGDGVQLYRNDTTLVLSRTISSADTTIIDTQLSPKTSYRYKAYRLHGGMLMDSTGPLLVTTMDTTSHNFTWEIDTLGDGAGSVLHDVAIINDTLVYAVGEIYRRDSSGQFETEPYGLAIWNGHTWRLVKVPYHDYGSTQLSPGSLNTVYGFSDTDIFVSSAANLLHWDGRQWTEKAFVMTDLSFNGQILKMWGSNSSNLYLVGRNGAVYHYNGSTWKKMESGTTLDIQDIYGAQDKTGEWEILAVAANPYSSYDRKILHLSGITVSTLSDSGINWPLSGVWFSPDRIYYVAGSGIYTKQELSGLVWSRVDAPKYYIDGIRANDINDIIAAGGSGGVLHFNGFTWRNYISETRIGYGNYYGVAIHDNLAMAVGEDNPRAIVAIGKRIERR